MLIFLVGVTVERASGTELSCPEAPKQIDKDVMIDAQGKIGKLGPLAAGELQGKVSLIAKDFLVKYPNADKLAVANALISVTCEFLKASTTLSDNQKLIELRELRKEILELFGVIPRKAMLPRQPPSLPHGPLSKDDLARSRREIALRIVARQKSTGSIQVAIEDPTWKDQAWTTATASVALLSTSADIVGGYRSNIWNAVRYLDTAKNPSGGGWQLYQGEGPSLLIPTAWVTMAYARLGAYPAVWNDEERKWVRVVGVEALSELVRYRDATTGGFYSTLETPQNDVPRFAYSGVLALLALLDARSTGLSDLETTDEAIKGLVFWLIRQEEVQESECRFKADERTNRVHESLGLTVMSLYALARAHRAGFSVETGRCVVAVLDELNRRLKARLSKDSLDGTEDDVVYAGISLRVMWFPWAVLWVNELASASESPGRNDVQTLKAELLDKKRFETLIDTFSADATWRLSETLLALGLVSVAKQLTTTDRPFKHRVQKDRQGERGGRKRVLVP